MASRALSPRFLMFFFSAFAFGLLLPLGSCGAAWADEETPAEAGVLEELEGEVQEASGAEDHANHDHEGEHHDAADHSGGEAPDPLATDPDLALWTAAVFFITLAVLYAVAWGPIRDGLAARESNITGEIDAAAAKHEEAKALLAQHEAKLASAADEVRELLEEARRDAETTKGQIVAEAQAAAEAERKRAMLDIEQARDSAVKHLAEQSANMAFDLAAKVVRQDISADRQSEIVREALGRMASNTPSSN